jgi:hypothetical protein
MPAANNSVIPSIPQRPAGPFFVVRCFSKRGPGREAAAATPRNWLEILKSQHPPLHPACRIRDCVLTSVTGDPDANHLFRHDYKSL